MVTDFLSLNTLQSLKYFGSLIIEVYFEPYNYVSWFWFYSLINPLS